MATVGNHFATKNRKENHCQSCDYFTSNKYDFQKHLSTVKHKFAILETNWQPLATDFAIFCDKSQDDVCKQKRKNMIYLCDDCGKKYKDKSGLWKHRKKHVTNERNNDDRTEISSQIVVQLDSGAEAMAAVAAAGGAHQNNIG